MTYEYELEELENVRVPNAEVEEPSHLLTVSPADANHTYANHRYYVDVDGDEIWFVMERAGSARSYEKHTMFPPKYRAVLEADGWDVRDPGEHIGPETVDRVEQWLADQGVDPETAQVRVSPRFRSVTFSPNGFLEGEAWEAYIGTMRAHDVIRWAESQQVHYVEDDDLPRLLEGKVDA